MKVVTGTSKEIMNSLIKNKVEDDDYYKKIYKLYEDLNNKTYSKSSKKIMKSKAEKSVPNSVYYGDAFKGRMVDISYEPFDGVVITLEKCKKDKIDSIYEWLVRNTNGRIAVESFVETFNEGNSYRFYFEERNEALLFKTTWKE